MLNSVIGAWCRVEIPGSIRFCTKRTASRLLLRMCLHQEMFRISGNSLGRCVRCAIRPLTAACRRIVASVCDPERTFELPFYSVAPSHICASLSHLPPRSKQLSSRTSFRSHRPKATSDASTNALSRSFVVFIVLVGGEQESSKVCSWPIADLLQCAPVNRRAFLAMPGSGPLQSCHATSGSRPRLKRRQARRAGCRHRPAASSTRVRRN